MLTYWYWPWLVADGAAWLSVAAGWLGIGRQIPHAGAGWRWKMRPGRLQSHLQPAARSPAVLICRHAHHCLTPHQPITEGRRGCCCHNYGLGEETTAAFGNI